MEVAMLAQMARNGIQKGVQWFGSDDGESGGVFVKCSSGGKSGIDGLQRGGGSSKMVDVASNVVVER